MKKIKFLIGFLVIGLGILSQSFADYDIELVATQFGFVPDYSVSYSNLFRVSYRNAAWSYNNGSTWYNVPYFGYGVYINNILSSDRLVYSSINSSSDSHCYSNVVFNTSLFSLDTINGSCESSYSGFVQSNFLPRQYTVSGGSSMSFQFDFGEGSQSGLAFIEPVGLAYSPSKRPVYGFGNGFFTNNEYFTYSSTEYSKGARILYQTTGTNVLDSLDFVGPVSTQAPIYAWQLFSPYMTMTNYGTVKEIDGSYKGRHFGLFSFGYSFAYNKISGSQTSWNNFGLYTVEDDAIQVIHAGSVDFTTSDPNDYFHNNGILALKKYSFYTNQSNGIVLISKNPYNVKQLLYQEYNCLTSSIDCLFNGGNHCTSSDGNINNSSGFSCIVTSQGVLSYSGSTDILPFTDYNSLVNISSSPILTYFLQNGNRLGDVWLNGSSYCFGDTPGTAAFCLGKVSGSQSIKENYLNGYYSNDSIFTSTGVDNFTKYNCLHTDGFAVSNPDLCWPYTNVVFSGTSSYTYTQVCDSNGNCAYQLVPSSLTGNTITDSSGNIYVISSGNNASLSFGSEYYSSGVLSTGYYNIDNTGWFFRCPYPTQRYIDIPGLNLGQFDIFLPLNCFISAFQHGRTYELFGQYGLFTSYNHPLIYGDSTNHKFLFTFLDFVISLSLFSFILFLYRLLK